MEGEKYRGIEEFVVHCVYQKFHTCMGCWKDKNNTGV